VPAGDAARVDALAREEDSVLVRRARAGDHAAWNALIHRHAPSLAAYLGTRLRRPALVDRLVGNTICSAWRCLQELPDGAEFAPWLRRLGGSHAMAWHEEHPTQPLAEPFPAERCREAEQAERMARLDDALGRLPEAQRRLIEERWRGGLDEAQLASLLRMEPDQVAGALEQALAALDAELAQPPERMGPSRAAEPA
jgi:RNA polymerase sigma-70 factor (ECF subfamily)